MSNPDSIAAYFWSWPDPVIKRDFNGAVQFVNAAFLQIYGGQVTDWHGCAVDGWPAPATGPNSNNFETRVPSPSGEIIYDWLEHVMSDGGALAISRNVTALYIHMPPNEPSALPVQKIPETIPHHAAQQVSQAPAQTYVEETHLAISAHAEQQQTDIAQPQEETALNIAHDNINVEAKAVEITSKANDELPDLNVPEITVPKIEVPTIEVTEQVASSSPVSDLPPKQADTQRDFERRTLPVENGDSLLGENWRDAVIAKAVGAAEAPEAAQESQIRADEAVLAASDMNQLSSTEDSESGGAELSILLAEDNAINALLTRTLLEADGCQVDVVEDGQLAVEAMQTNTYDMILMDMRMPNMDGLESTRKIRSLNSLGQNIPIIALTANAFDDDRNACFDAGMNDFMTKPVSAEELQQMVQTWTNKSTMAA